MSRESNSSDRIRRSEPRVRGRTTFRRAVRNGLRFEQLEARQMLAVDIELIKDINGIFNSAGSSPSNFVEVGSGVFFTATTNLEGTELWKTDGTEAGTALVKDINLGSASSFPSELTNVNGTLFFRAFDASHGSELWKSDGTAAGTELVKDIATAFSSNPAYLTNVGGTLFFSANDGTQGVELWKSDGTAAGTTLAADILPGTGSSTPNSMINVGGTLYFRAHDGVNGEELWKTVGTTTTLVEDIRVGANSSSPRYMTNVNGTLYFTAVHNVYGRELWKSNGTAATTSLVKDIIVGTTDSSPQHLTNVGGTLFFNGGYVTSASGRELWKSDGTSAGTVVVRDIEPGITSSYPQNLTNVDGTLYFAARRFSSPFIGTELWKSDGTYAGTTLVRDIRVGTGSYPSSLTNVAGTLYFTANDGIHGSELWKSDGTSDGTALIRDIRVGGLGSDSTHLTSFGGTLLFNANDGSHGAELWKSDGTATGTTLAKDIRAGSLFASPDSIVNMGGTLYFAANDGTHGKELWRSDGTASGTTLVKDIYVGNSNSFPSELTVVENTLYFRATDGVSGSEFWRSDGTADGTFMVKDIFPGSTGSFPGWFTNIDGTLFFRADDSTHGLELWKSDGTLSGTTLVEDIDPGTGPSAPISLTNVSGSLFFVADDGSTGNELWKSDGTAAGTNLVRDIRAGYPGSVPIELTNVNGILYFSASDGTNGSELWKSDGTLGGTVMVKDINTSGSSNPGYLTNVDGTLFFDAYDSTHGDELWKSDGTATGTTLVKDIALGVSGSIPRHLTNVDGALFFNAADTASGRELWKSNGTAAGTTLLKDIVPGPDSSGPVQLTISAGRLFFAADGTSGIDELWQSDGTSLGTQAVEDPSGGRTPPVDRIVEANGRVLFRASTNEFGSELFGLFDEVDYGDAPTLTTHADDGARHNAAGPTLGLLRDSNENGVPSAGADSDDNTSLDDEDGVTVLSLIRGNMSSISVSVVNVGSTARLNGWIDWNQDGDWDDADEHVIADEVVTAGSLALPISVPANALLGNAAARFRVSEESGLGPTGFAFSGEVEDYILTVMQVLSVVLPDESTNDIVLRKEEDNVEVYDLNAESVIASSPLAYTHSISVAGSDLNEDAILVDYEYGGFFNLPGGIDVSGGTYGGDQLYVQGTGTTQAVYSMAMAPVGQTQLTVSETTGSDIIRYSEFDYLTFNNLLSFEATSTLSLGYNSLVIGSSTPVNLSNLTLINGGTLTSSSVVTLGPGESLIGYGTVDGRFSGEAGSLIQATGNLSIGKSSSTSGFVTRGDLDVGGNRVYLLDANQAVLGTETTVDFSPLGLLGIIYSANGLLVDFGNNVSGWGTLNTPNDVTKLLMNNGSISGNSASQKITLPGYVKGVGTLDNVNITGTHSPGFSPAAVQYGSVTYGASSSTIIEIGGTTPGSSGHDQINHSGTAALSGTLAVQLINNFTPALGNSFVIMTAAGGITGGFDDVALPAPPLGSQWKVDQSTNQLVLEVVDITDVVDVTINGSTANLNRSGIATLAIEFEDIVTATSPSSLILRNHTTGQTINLSGATYSGNGTSHTITWDLLGVSLPDGRYTAELPAAEVLDSNNLPLGSTYAVEFLKRTGDMNGDGAVNFADYGVIGANFDPLQGNSFRAGDADGNGAVNFADYGVIGANFGPIPLAGLQLDYGDAPESSTSYPTTLAHDGARHILGGTTYLGSGVDAEADGQPSAAADGDGSDEDGVAWGTLMLGVSNTIDVTVAAAGSVFLNAWIDLNQDGDWDDAGEQVLQDAVASNGLNSLPISISATASMGNAVARVRVTDTAGQGYKGLAPTGEVEDYQVNIAPPPTASSGGEFGETGLDTVSFSSLSEQAVDVFFGDLEKRQGKTSQLILQ